MTIDELAKRVQVLEDIEAIRKLKAEYCHACDDHFNAKRMGKIFTEDGVWDGGGEQRGIFRGRKAIEDWFTKLQGMFKFSMHYCTIVPDINVHGDKADANWYGLTLCTNMENRAVWMALFYEDKYAKQGGRWLFEYTTVHHLFITPFEGQGWGKMQFMDEA